MLREQILEMWAAGDATAEAIANRLGYRCPSAIRKTLARARKAGDERAAYRRRDFLLTQEQP